MRKKVSQMHKMVKKRGTGSFLGGMYHIFRSKTLRNTFFKKIRKNVICTQNYTAFDSPYPPPLVHPHPPDTHAASTPPNSSLKPKLPVREIAAIRARGRVLRADSGAE